MVLRRGKNGLLGNSGYRVLHGKYMVLRGGVYFGIATVFQILWSGGAIVSFYGVEHCVGVGMWPTLMCGIFSDVVTGYYSIRSRFRILLGGMNNAENIGIEHCVSPIFYKTTNPSSIQSVPKLSY